MAAMANDHNCHVIGNANAFAMKIFPLFFFLHSIPTKSSVQQSHADIHVCMLMKKKLVQEEKKNRHAKISSKNI